MAGTILVTGANGYIGLHLIKVALEKGYNVRATARSQSSLQGIVNTFPEYSDKISTAIVKDITDPEQYKDAFDSSITFVMHTASPFDLNAKDVATETLDPAINGATAILAAAKKYGPSVKRVVTTSSFAAIVDLSQGNREGYTYSEADWNPMTYEEASKADATTAYAASKGLAERAQWAWMDANKPGFGLTSMNPGWVFGPNVKALPISRLGESSAGVWSLVGAEAVPQPDFRVGVDVRDVAMAHIVAAETDEAAGERLLLGQTFSWQIAADAIRETVPEVKDKVPVDGPNSKSAGYTINATKAPKMLGFEYTPISTTMKDSVMQYLTESVKLG